MPYNYLFVIISGPDKKIKRWRGKSSPSLISLMCGINIILSDIPELLVVHGAGVMIQSCQQQAHQYQSQEGVRNKYGCSYVPLLFDCQSSPSFSFQRHEKHFDVKLLYPKHFFTKFVREIMIQFSSHIVMVKMWAGCGLSLVRWDLLHKQAKRSTKWMNELWFRCVKGKLELKGFAWTHFTMLDDLASLFWRQSYILFDTVQYMWWTYCHQNNPDCLCISIAVLWNLGGKKKTKKATLYVPNPVMQQNE